MKRGLFAILITLLFGLIVGTSIQAEMIEDDTTSGVYYDDVRVRLSAMSSQTSLVITDEERIFTWGRNNYGSLGNPDLTISPIPQEITPSFDLAYDETVSMVAGGSDYYGLVTSTNRFFMWGYNYHGELGMGNTTLYTSPIEITNQFVLNDGEMPVIEVTGNVNVNVEGTYEIQYSATDSNGNVTYVSRVVHVIDD